MAKAKRTPPASRPSAAIRSVRDQRSFEERRIADADEERKIRSMTPDIGGAAKRELLEHPAVAAAISGLCTIIGKQAMVAEALNETFMRHNQGAERTLETLDRQHEISERQHDIAERMLLVEERMLTSINMNTEALRAVTAELEYIRLRDAASASTNGHAKSAPTIGAPLNVDSED